MLKLCVALCSLFILSACHPLFLQGKICDERGVPISNAIIILRSGIDETTLEFTNTSHYFLSSQKGIFKLDSFNKGDTLIVSKQGYEIDTIILDYFIKNRISIHLNSLPCITRL